MVRHHNCLRSGLELAAVGAVTIELRAPSQSRSSAEQALHSGLPDDCAVRADSPVTGADISLASTKLTSEVPVPEWQ